MKKLILFLLLPLWAMAQTTTGQEQEFDYGIKNNSAQTITTPPYLTTTGIDGTQGKIPSALIALKSDLPVSYTKVVYVNTTSPSTATIFDDVNPPVINDNLLKSDAANLYIGTDASTWVWNSSSYVTKTIPDGSNFWIYPFENDIPAGSNKNEPIVRKGDIFSDGNITAGLSLRSDNVQTNSVNVAFETANTIASFDAGKQLRSLPTDTYPSLTELSYVKGATSGIQSQINGKENTFSKNTAFNKNFGTTAGTVAEGNDSRINNGQTAFGWGNHAGKYPLYNGTGATGTWNIGISGNAGSATNWGGTAKYQDADNGNGNYIMVTTGGTDVWKYRPIGTFRTDLGLGTNAYTSTAYLPLSGGTLSGDLNGTSVTAAKLSVSSLAIGTQTLLELGEPGYVATNYGSVLESSSATGLFSLFNYNAGVKSTTPVLSWSRVSSNMTFGGAATFSSTVTATSFNGSATLTGTPTAPTAAPGTNTPQIATMEALQAATSVAAKWTETSTNIRNNNSGEIELKPSTKVSILNASNVENINLKPDGNIIATNFIAAPVVGASGQSGMYGLASGQFLRFDSWNGNSELPAFEFRPIYTSFNAALGETTVGIYSGYTISPTSGNTGVTMLQLKPTINQTGGANGIIRGIYINPTLTSAFDFRAIEVTAGKSMFKEVIADGVIRLKNYTVATLPTGTQGDTAYVTDATAPTYLGTLTGGGSVVCPVFYNGTAWVAH